VHALRMVGLGWLEGGWEGGMLPLYTALDNAQQRGHGWVVLGAVRVCRLNMACAHAGPF
jgi:hypothetical protein